MVWGRLRQPEYTGENRCLPCTIVNVVITGGFALLVAIIEPILAVPVVVGGFLAIYLRGYLVPGTPTLTMRYLPDQVLAWFDKSPPTVEESGFEPETVLLEEGLAESTGEDIRLVEPVRTALHDRFDRYREGPSTDQVAAFVGQPDADLEWRETDQGVVAQRGGRVVGRWESRAALIADLAGADVLEQRVAGWASIDAVDRARLTSGLRALLERCPICGSTVSLSEETVESCCRSRPVYALSCADCGARLLEVPQ